MLAQTTQRLAARGMGAGMGGGGHANNPTFMFGADWAKNKWKGAIGVFSLFFFGGFIPYRCIAFAQKKAGFEWP
jgi:hypothetical protein